VGSKRAAATSFTLSRRRVYTLIIAAVGGFQQQQQQHLRASAVPLVCARYLAVAAAPAALWLEMLKKHVLFASEIFHEIFQYFCVLFETFLIKSSNKS